MKTISRRVLLASAAPVLLISTAGEARPRRSVPPPALQTPQPVREPARSAVVTATTPNASGNFGGPSTGGGGGGGP
ncbi:hypothetical protein [Enterovirga aerilata]|uniref:Uncharacterized protein n=1 Tax=Enterovirga aerilata TaxID=2730920 RepID=A0A849IBC5_9HYPH|nr:hypothetical protein [Enterovirga sp. DB1703]NNM75224.1 hypothetical protein [Enterovirga sp. DB1703]